MREKLGEDCKTPQMSHQLTIGQSLLTKFNQSVWITAFPFQVWPSHWFRPWFFFGRFFLTEHLTAHHLFTRPPGMGIQKTTPREANKPTTESPESTSISIKYFGNICPPWKLGGRCPSNLDFAHIFQMKVESWNHQNKLFRLGDVAGWHKLWVDRTYGKPIIEARRVGNGISCGKFWVQFVPLTNKGRWS